MTTTNRPTIEEAAAVFLEQFSSSDLAAEVASTLTCSEVDALANLLSAQGADAESAAAYWLAAHAENDDEGDAHYQGEQE